MKPWLPEGCKSGLRLGLGLFALALVDFLVQGPDAAQGGSEGSTAYNYIHQGALWAAVTLIVVSAPEFVGATAWLCIQRLLGNIMGGWLACGLVIAVRSGVGLAFITFGVVFITSFIRFNDLTRFGGFFCVTFCIVAFQGFYMGNLDVVILAGSRVAAICIGVVFALVLACTIFPMSASGKAVEMTRDALEATVVLNRLAWRGLHLEDPTAGEGSSTGSSTQANGDAVIDVEHDVVERKPARSSRAASLRQLWRRGRNAFNRTVAPEKVREEDLNWEDQVSRTYISFTRYLEAMFNARSEIYIGTDCYGHRWFAPSIKWLTKRRWHMPIGELWAVRVALRETRQGVFGLQNMLAQGFDAEMMQALLLVFPKSLLRELEESCAAALAELLDACPGQNLIVKGWAPADGIERFLAATESLLTMAGERHKRQSSAGTSSADSSRHGAHDFAAHAGGGASLSTALQNGSKSAHHSSSGSGATSSLQSVDIKAVPADDHAADQSAALAAVKGSAGSSQHSGLAAAAPPGAELSSVRQHMTRLSGMLAASLNRSAHGGTLYADHVGASANGRHTAEADAVGSRPNGDATADTSVHSAPAATDAAAALHEQLREHQHQAQLLSASAGGPCRQLSGRQTSPVGTNGAAAGTWSRVRHASLDFPLLSGSPAGHAAIWQQQAMMDSLEARHANIHAAAALAAVSGSIAGGGAMGPDGIDRGMAALHPPSPFPDTLEGYVAQVRWSGFSVLLVALGGSLVRLHTALNTVLPLLPGSELKGQKPPPPIDAGRWGRVSAAMASLRPYLRDAQPGVGAGQAEGVAQPFDGKDGGGHGGGGMDAADL